jgi:hypothetical protein
LAAMSAHRVPLMSAMGQKRDRYPGPLILIQRPNNEKGRHSGDMAAIGTTVGEGGLRTVAIV